MPLTLTEFLMNLNYIDAALVIDRPVQVVIRLLSNARIKIIVQKEFATS